MTRSGTRAGSVLALSILVLVALQLLAHGALLMARAEWASSLAGLHLLQARSSAEAGALAALEGPAGVLDSVPVSASAPPVAGSLAGHPFHGRMRRLSREYWLVEGRGRARGEPWGVTVRYLAWLLDPRGRIAAAEGGVEVAGVLSGSDGVTLDRDRPAFCRGWRTALDSVVSPGVWGRAHRLSPSPAGEPSLGRLGREDLARALPRLDATSGTPTPVSTQGRCDGSAAWNWGDPRNDDAPCRDRLVAWSAPDDLRLGAGVGQGLLTVAGDLELLGTRFDGVLLVGGSLALRDGAQVRGLVRVGGDLEVTGESRIRGSPCRALRALESFRSLLQGPVHVREAGLLEGGE